MVNFGPLAAEIVSLVWGTRANFNGIRVLAALLHGTLVMGVEQRTPPMFGRAAIMLGIWPTFLVCFCCVRFSFFSTTPRDWLEEQRLRNDRFCVEWEAKTLTRSILETAQH